MSTRTPASKSPWTFFSLVFLLSVPFWLIGAVAGDLLQRIIRINLPISAFMFVNPLMAAAILAYRENGSDGLKELLKRSVDYRRIKRKIWYVPIFCLWPTIIVVAYGLMRLAGASLPDDPQVPILMAPAFLVVFFVSAAGEQLGWQLYGIDPLQERRSALEASVIVGLVWGIWHIVPFMQLQQTPAWIVWQSLGMVPFRVLIVWIYNNTGKSVFATIAFQATSNVSQFLFPNYGSHYDPFFAWLVLAFAAAIVTFLWGPKTLARYRFAR